MLNGGAYLSGLVVNGVKRSGRYGRYYYYYYKYNYRYANHRPDRERDRPKAEVSS
jgi:hypothetical protein